jgi:hypothetical protein
VRKAGVSVSPRPCGNSAERRKPAYLRDQGGSDSVEPVFLQAEFMCMSAASTPNGARWTRLSDEG